MYLFGAFYATTLFILPFKKEVEINDEADESSLPLDTTEATLNWKINLPKPRLYKKIFIAYKLLWNLLKIKPIRLVALVLLTCKVI